jgi:DNA-binding protein YbaB
MPNPLKQIGELKKLRDQAVKLQKDLDQEKVTIEDSGIKVVITGTQKFEDFEIQGISNPKVTEVLNKAIKKSQEVAAKKMQSMSGGLKGMMGMLGGGE